MEPVKGEFFGEVEKENRFDKIIEKEVEEVVPQLLGQTYVHQGSQPGPSTGPKIRHTVSFAVDHMDQTLPLPVTSPGPSVATGLSRKRMSSSRSIRTRINYEGRPNFIRQPTSRVGSFISTRTGKSGVSSIFSSEDIVLLPATMPPKFSIYDIFPFTMFVKPLSETGMELDGQKAARYRAKTNLMNHNVPLEVLFYLVSTTSYVDILILMIIPELLHSRTHSKKVNRDTCRK